MFLARTPTECATDFISTHKHVAYVPIACLVRSGPNFMAYASSAHLLPLRSPGAVLQVIGAIFLTLAQLDMVWFLYPASFIPVLVTGVGVMGGMVAMLARLWRHPRRPYIPRANLRLKAEMAEV